MSHSFRSVTFFLIALCTLSVAYSTSLGVFKTCPSLLQYMVYNSGLRASSWELRPSFQCFFHRSLPRLRSRNAPVAAETFSAELAAASPVEGEDFSGTNVQVSGVDEPDIVKTDGERVFAVSRGRFYYVKVTKSGMDGKVVANLTVPTSPRNMLFDSKSDSIVIIAQEYVRGFDPIISPRNRRFIPSCRSLPVVHLYRISVKNEWDVKITDRARIPGRYISARSVNNIGHLVFSYDPADNIDIFKKDMTLNDWLPSYTASGTYCDGKACRKYGFKRQVSDCASTYYPVDEFSGFSLLTVATFDLRGYFIIKGSTIVADGDKVYATANSMYVATSRYRYDLDDSDGRIGRGFRTSFHKFELGKYRPRYIGSGDVRGSVLNQFSMHEYKDTFFVATTEGASWWRSRDLSESKVSSFRVSSNKLLRVGEVGGLGKGERIYAVRYLADVAYIVTFRQIDPLYILDLSNVYKLKVTGELKIPGYSAYLHPIAPGRILGVGRDATLEGRVTGAKVSLFDVSNVKSPIELSSWTLKGSYSTAEWEHKAFLWWGPEKIAVLPLSVYYRNTGKRFVGSIVLDVSDQYISERGRISHSGGSSTKTILRNFVISRTNLWSLSSSLLQVNGIKDLKTKSSISLPYTPRVFFPKPIRTLPPIPIDPIPIDPIIPFLAA